MTGRIFNIQRYSIHDGSGIRTIVFFKGCLLRCRWCCNPESQRYEIEQMNGEAVGRDADIAEILTEIERDRAYYRRSGGGLTLSGGEALLQADFAIELLKTASEKGIHTAIESTAMVEYNKIEKALPYLNEFLMDIKHMDAAKHQEYTGKRNETALENAKKIAASGLCELMVRVPVIPGFNDTESEIAAIAGFADTLPGVIQMHLLPYHRLGESKYEALGRRYEMGDVKTPDNDLMERLKTAAQRASCLSVQIGG